MTRAHDLARDAVLNSSLRPVAKAIGISYQTLADYIDSPDSSSEKTREKVERWAVRQSVSRGPDVDLVLEKDDGTKLLIEAKSRPRSVSQSQVDAGLPELARLVEKALSLEGDARFRAWALAELNAAYRCYALAREADNAGARARAVEGEGRAAEQRLSAISGGAVEAAKQDADVAARASSGTKGHRKQRA